uniref:Myb/SANT-like domain-containing protein n=1 Tax=Fagus sylvatica TaxID=28930 RepID=A0A2N9EIJ2_FAGSY
MTELNDTDDAKLWPPNVEKLFIQLMVEEMVKGNMQEVIFHKRIWDKILEELIRQTKWNYKFSQTNTVSSSDEVWMNVLAAIPKAKEFRRKGCENYIQLGTLFNKTTTTSVMAFASTQDPTNTDEEREIDKRFINTGMHVNVDVDVEVDLDIGEDPKPVQGDVRETRPEKQAKSGNTSKSKKSARKGERVGEMTNAINNFAYIIEKMNEVREARHAAKYAAKVANTTTSSAHPFMKTTPPVDDCSLQKAMELLDTYKDIPPEKFCKIMLALYKQNHRVAFLTFFEERRAIWMEFMGNM